MEINEKFLSPCGLYCGVCGVYYATRNNNPKFLEKLLNFYQNAMPGLETFYMPDPFRENGVRRKKGAIRFYLPLNLTRAKHGLPEIIMKKNRQLQVKLKSVIHLIVNIIHYSSFDHCTSYA